MTHMDAYRAAVLDAKNRRNGEPVIANRSYAHATVIVEHLFEAARHKVQILTERLAPEVFDDEAVKAAATGFFERCPDGTLEILVENDIANHPFLAALAPFQQRITVTRVPEEVVGRYSYNFCLVDDDCYRFEQDRGSVEATIQFGNTVTAQQIQTAFNAIRGLSQPLPADR